MKQLAFSRAKALKKQFEKDFGTGSNAKTELTECARFFMIFPVGKMPLSGQNPQKAQAQQRPNSTPTSQMI